MKIVNMNGELLDGLLLNVTAEERAYLNEYAEAVRAELNADTEWTQREVPWGHAADLDALLYGADR